MLFTKSNYCIWIIIKWAETGSVPPALGVIVIAVVLLAGFRTVNIEVATVVDIIDTPKIWKVPVAIIKPFSINNSYVEILQLNIFVNDDFELLLYFALADYLVNKNNNRSIKAAKMSVLTGITHF